MARTKAKPVPAESGSKGISETELSQRVAVLKRFKELLKTQRDRFQAYLTALDKQKDVIQSGNTDELLRHVELEEKIVADIFSIQKVIDPLEEMYKTISVKNPVKGSSKSSARETGEEEVISLKEALDGLKTEAILRSERNRELLAKRMAELRAEINSMKKNSYSRRKFDTSTGPSYIDIKG
jgi:acyl-CoA reductase-like NAD-dependent aldehyde dehydrogenase